MNDKYYYSPKNNAFYIENVSPEIPDDAMEITETEHASLIKSINEDQKCITIIDGKITLVDRVRTTEEISAGIKSQLNNIDIESIRAIRSVLVAIHAGSTPDAGDISKLTRKELDVVNLRSEMHR